jgi:peptide/nickel transport system substrate-binding protein
MNMHLRRRQFVQTAAAALAAPTVAAALAAPTVAAAAEQRVLKFIPQADLAALDPVFSSAYVTRNHGYLVFDTLYGMDEHYRPQPQMVSGHTVDDDGKTWVFTLRDGLTFHDGTPVLGRDAAASIKRWGQRDTFGQALMAVADEIDAPTDKTLRFRLKKRFPLLPSALAKAPSYMPCIMPERLAKTDAATQVTEMVGSGPYRFMASEQVPGAHFAYERFSHYAPRTDGTPSFTAGPKKTFFDRIEWHVVPDAATAAAALQAGEVDWWEQPTIDLQPLLRRSGDVVVEITDPTGVIGSLRMNCLQPPFDNPAIRRALLGAIDQGDFMQAIVGTDPAMWRNNVGVYCPASPMANDAGIAVLGQHDIPGAQRALTAAGYAGEPVVLLAPADFPSIGTMAQVTADLLKRLGMNVQFQSMDWGTLTQRRTSMEPTGKGGWSCFNPAAAGLELFDPTTHNQMRGNGKAAWFGWPTSARLEALRDAWFDAPDLGVQQALCRELQMQNWQDVPFIPLGQFFQPTAYRKSVTGVLKGGFALFYNVRRAA